LKVILKPCMKCTIENKCLTVQINIVLVPASNSVRVQDRERRQSLFNRLKQWPWFSLSSSKLFIICFI